MCWFSGKGKDDAKLRSEMSGPAPWFQSLGYWLGFPWAGSARGLGSGALTERRALQPPAMEGAPQRAWRARHRVKALFITEPSDLCKLPCSVLNAVPSFFFPIAPSGGRHVPDLGHGLTTPAREFCLQRHCAPNLAHV